MSPDFVREIISKGEDYRRELKAARHAFDRGHDLVDYCAALGNEGGGYLILGVRDDGTPCGTEAFKGNLPKQAHFLYQRIGHRVETHELLLEDKRVVVFDVPGRNPGEVIKSSGHYHAPMRLGESLQEMDDNTMRDILNETLEDFSVKRSAVALNQIDEDALDLFTERYGKKHGIDRDKLDVDQLLKDMRLVENRRLTNTGLLLIGRAEVISRELPQAEIILEWRQDTTKVNFDFRQSWRGPLVKTLDEVWSAVDARNIRIPFQEGLTQKEVVAFDEKSVREAVLNAVTHRDYRIASESIFIKINPERFLVTSPGGFVAGVNAENAIDKSAWRNRQLAETLQYLGLVERSGQGLDDIYLKTISDGKGKPTLLEVQKRQVVLGIPAMVRDAEFVKFLERVAAEKHVEFTPREMLVLEEMREDGFAAEPFHKEELLTKGVIERIGRGKGTKYILTSSYYAYADKKGVHTRLVGTSRAVKKQLILDHIRRHSKVYNYELQDAFPDMKMGSISALLGELSAEGKIKHEGSRRYGYWVLNTN